MKMRKKGTLKIQKSLIAILVINQPPISAVFPIVRFAGNPKTALTGESLYYNFGQKYPKMDTLGHTKFNQNSKNVQKFSEPYQLDLYVVAGWF